MDSAALRQKGNDMMAAMSRDKVRNTSRGAIRSAIVARLRVRTDLNADESRFVGDYLMAQYGYGGGL